MNLLKEKMTSSNECRIIIIYISNMIVPQFLYICEEAS